MPTTSFKKKVFILSISSDIGFELANHWIDKGYDVQGTYKTPSEKCKSLKKRGAKLFYLDIKNRSKIQTFLKKNKPFWNWLIFATGTQDPVGSFTSVKSTEWVSSVEINFVNQFFFLKEILKFRSKKNSRVLFFAGGGTNNATINYSAYTISKIASTKMCELLAAEIKDTIFSILGPGWVNTKIHKSTLTNKIKAGKNYFRTLKMLKDKKCFPMTKVIDACEWILNQKKKLVNGRNFSAVHDPWNNKKINKILKNDNNFKLRRFGNNLFN